MRRALPLLPLLLLGLAACGSNDAAPIGDDAETRDIVFACLTEQKGIDARLEGDEEILLTDDEDGPHIRFFLTAGEAEAAQFEGDGEGAEQIGAGLLFVEPEVTPQTEELLADAEACLADQ